jgi:hypothetical protein
LSERWAVASQLKITALASFEKNTVVSMGKRGLNHEKDHQSHMYYIPVIDVMAYMRPII